MPQLKTSRCCRRKPAASDWSSAQRGSLLSSTMRCHPLFQLCQLVGIDFGFEDRADLEVILVQLRGLEQKAQFHDFLDQRVDALLQEEFVVALRQHWQENFADLLAREQAGRPALAPSLEKQELFVQKHTEQRDIPAERQMTGQPR